MAHSSEVSEYVANIVANEGEDPIEIPLQDDGTISLAQLNSEFSKFGQVTGLFFRTSQKRKRAVKLDTSRNCLLPPEPLSKWDDTHYICVFNKTSTGNSNNIV